MGMYPAKKVVDLNMTLVFDPDIEGVIYVERGYKKYELSNHLGNVLMVISDRREGMNCTMASNIYAYYQADIIMATDYYPFGSTMPGREWNTTASVNGFNGMRKDDEWQGSGNAYDFGARMYDPRLGRFLRVDPREVNQPWQSPYCYGNNRPIDGVDIGGNEWFPLALVQAMMTETNKEIEAIYQPINSARAAFGLTPIQVPTYKTIDEFAAAMGYKLHTTVDGKSFYYTGSQNSTLNSYHLTYNDASYDVFNTQAFANETQVEILGKTDEHKVVAEANKNGQAPLPPSADAVTGSKQGCYDFEGQQIYFYHNRKDVGGIEDQWLLPKVIRAVINASLSYQDSYSGKLPSFGDLMNDTKSKYYCGIISKKTGMKVCHHGGTPQADTRWFVQSGGTMSYTDKDFKFDPVRTAAFFDAMYNAGFMEVLGGKDLLDQVKPYIKTDIILTNDADHSDHPHFQKFDSKKGD